MDLKVGVGERLGMGVDVVDEVRRVMESYSCVDWSAGRHQSVRMGWVSGGSLSCVWGMDGRHVA